MATNFLIGRGEVLAYNVAPPPRSPPKRAVYTLDEAREALVPQIASTVEAFNAAPAEALPDDVVVAKFVINPAYIAKSSYPKDLLLEAGLEAVGSRTVTVTPRKWLRKGAPQEVPTTQLFVAGSRKRFRALPSVVQSFQATDRAADDFAHMEAIAPFEPADKVKGYAKGKRPTYEVGIHMFSRDPNLMQAAFLRFAKSVGVALREDLGFFVGNLWFLPVSGEREAIDRLSAFSLVRVIRPMPHLRSMRPMPMPSAVPLRCDLPTAQPLSSQPRVAILDGGLPDHHPIGRWVRRTENLDSDANDHQDGPEHGLAVSSAFLFGPIRPDGQADRPYSFIDHLRVVDAEIDDEHQTELYRTLGLVEQVLLSREYEFLNLSLGPEAVVDDGDPHGWTSLIDDQLSDGRTFMTVAIGNNGTEDAETQLNRIQVPGDCVNVVSVGAANSTSSSWERAPYSAVGPGRSPGYVKPDLMAFGGSSGEYFHALVPGVRPALAPQLGTSFAAPYLLRSAVGIRAIMGDGLSVLAIKALLVHGASRANGSPKEVGWGKVPENLMDVITCGSGVARIVYQGSLNPGKYLRAPLPIPAVGLRGFVQLKATFCFATPTDPHHSGSYTRSGLEVVFRPNDSRRKEDATLASSRSFFSRSEYADEQSRRADAGKWETVLHAEERLRGSSLVNPVFDIHYIARQDAGPTRTNRPLAYALVVTIEAPKHADLFATILSEYESLVAIQPEISLPVRI